MIDVIGSAVEDHIIDKIKAAKFFTILADEVTDCSNYCDQDSDKSIREDFLGFITVECITGATFLA